MRALVSSLVALLVACRVMVAAEIAAINGTAIDGIAALNGTAIAGIAARNGETIAGGGGGPVALIDETWIGTYTWSTNLGAGSVYDPDDTTLGLGGDNLRLVRTSSTTVIALSFTPSPVVYLRITGFRLEDVGAANFSTLQLYSGGGTVLENSLSIRQTTPTARWTINSASTTYAQTSATYAADTTYDLYLVANATAGTGSVELNANGTGRDGSGTDYAAQTSGDTGHNLDTLVFNLNNTNTLFVGRIELFTEQPADW